MGSNNFKGIEPACVILGEPRKTFIEKVIHVARIVFTVILYGMVTFSALFLVFVLFYLGVISILKNEGLIP